MTAIRHQRLGSFSPGAPLAGYYNDLTGFAIRNRHSLTDAVNPVTVAQIGLGAWQLSLSNDEWRPTVLAAATWLSGHMDDAGHLPYHAAMTHTYQLAPPWISAMAQGEAASFLLRAGRAFDAPELVGAAAEAVRSLLAPDSAVVALTTEGPVLQEYPTDPPAHVLNGWIFALWGLYDIACAGPTSVAGAARMAFDQGVNALASRLAQYSLPGGWSRYDLRAEGPVHVASPFYHHLHIQQLTALGQLVDEPVFTETALRWQRARRNPLVMAGAVAGKMRFRMQYPRRGHR